MPILTVIAGPNGAGKSTITRSVGFEGRDRLLDPDAIARSLNPMNPAAAAIAAGREVLRRTAEYLDTRSNFAIETTLSSPGRLDLIRKAKSRGYEVHLSFVGLESPERCISRIRNRYPIYHVATLSGLERGALRSARVISVDAFPQ